MKRLAAHYIIVLPDTRYKMHYIELSNDNRLIDIRPLTEEIEKTEFYNGTLFVKEGDHTEIYHSPLTDILPAEFGTSNGRSDSHIQRLC